MKAIITAVLTVALCAIPAATLVLPESASAQWIEVGVRPPEPRVEVRAPEPGAGYAWVPGYWEPHGRTHVWVEGRWERPRRAGYQWHSPSWQGHGRHWRFHRGHWGR